MTAREKILSRIRLGRPREGAGSHPTPEEGGRPAGPPGPGQAGSGTPAPGRGSLLDAFLTECERLSVTAHIARNADQAGNILASILDKERVETVLQWDPGNLPRIGMKEILRSRGIESVDSGAAVPVESLWRRRASTAEAGITGADWALADSGTLVLGSGPGRPRSASLLPMIHIALLRSRDILPDSRALIDRLFKNMAEGTPLDRSLTLITGPSKTSDIEMKPVQGVHGPGEIHVIVLTGTSDPETEGANP